MTTNSKSAQERTASIDLAQLDKLDKLEALASAADPTGAKHLITHYRYGADVDAEEAWRAAANPAAMQQLIDLARRSLTSGAPAEPFGMYVERADGTTEFQRTGKAFQPTAQGYKFWTLYAAPVHDAAAPSAEQAQWRNIQKAVQLVAEFCFGGPQQQGSVSMAAAYTSVVNCLTAKDGISLKLEPLSAGAAAKTEQADGTVIDYGTMSQASAAGAGSPQPPAPAGADHDHSEGGHVD
jgi:hypothetical protein